MAKIKILLADNHVVVREGLRRLLDAESDFNVVGEADDGVETLDRVKSLKPDIVIMDISMPRLSGIDAIRLIKEASKSAEIIILTMYQKRSYIREALHVGALGYMLKTSSFAEVTAAIRTVHRKKYFLSSEINADIIDNYLKKETVEPFLSKYDLLTRREQQVFRMMAEGNTTIEIAELLCISPKTVAKHRTNLMEKLQLKNTAALVRYAMKIGIIEPEDDPKPGF